MSPSQETSLIAGSVVGAMSLFALTIMSFMCGCCSRKACPGEEEPQPDIELGNTPKPQENRVWFARDSISELRTRQAQHPFTIPDETAGPSSSRRPPTPMPVPTSDWHDAAVAEAFAAESVSTGGGGSTVGEGTAPAEEQSNGSRVRQGED